MCETCSADIRAKLGKQLQYQLSDRKVMNVASVDDEGGVHVAGDGPSPAFHVDHAGALLHWLRDEHFICGIGSGTTAIKTLVGKGGKLGCDCSRCANNAKFLWGLLVAMPGVRRDGTSGLAPAPHDT